jgi:hypothetical protein
MATAIGRARSARAALISTLAITALALSAGSVSAAPPAPLSVDSTSLDFGLVFVTTTSAPQTVTVTAGRKDVVFQAGTDNGQYVIQGTSTCLVDGYLLAAGTSCTIDVAFAPFTSVSVPANLVIDTCMKWETNVGSGVPHCTRIKDTVTVSLSGSGQDLPQP